MIDCLSLYPCILGRPTLSELIVMPSTVHLKMKYYTSKGIVATLHGDIEVVRRCFKATSKGMNSIKPLPCIDYIDLDTRFYKDNLRYQRKEKASSTTIEDGQEHADPLRPILDREFKIILLGGDPSKGVKVRAGIPDLERKQLKACLRLNTDLFAWSALDMP